MPPRTKLQTSEKNSGTPKSRRGQSFISPPSTQVRKRRTIDSSQSVSSRKLKEDKLPTDPENTPVTCRLVRRPVTSVARRFRSEVSTSKTEEDKIQTRGHLKVEVDKEPQCTLCKQGTRSVQEKLKSCSKCFELFHIRRCLKFKPLMAENIEHLRNWQCARCICCKKCGDFINDPTNVECWACGHAWHGHCAPKGHTISAEFDSEWYCNLCARKRQFIKSKSPKPQVQGTIEFQDEKDVPESPKKKEEMKISWQKLMENRNHVHDQLADRAGVARSPQKGATRTPITTPLKIDANRSPIRRSPKKELGEIKLTSEFDQDLFKKSMEDYEKLMENQPKSDMKSNNNSRPWVTFGDGVAMLAVTDFEYSNEMPDTIHICKFCLVSTGDPNIHAIHMNTCQCHFPPGNEIYRDGKLSFFEVFGFKEQYYCRNLCKLARLFISSKTLHYEVETFIFYVLCEITQSGFEFVGYFSKEKNPSKNNNLSCLLTLPKAQRMGYGRMLIDLSYSLSRLERKIGCPEHPLSDLGVLAYRGYWRSSILCYLRSLKTNQVSIKEISMATRIHPNDVVNQLLKDRLLVHRNNYYYVKTGRRAFKYPLSMSRRRTVDMDKLFWKPDPSVNSLDPSKLNYYV